MNHQTIEQMLGHARQHQQQGRLSEAESLYRQILNSTPDHSGALHALGLLAAQEGRGDDAVDLFRRAIAIDPNVAAYHLHLGLVLSRTPRPDDAIAALRCALKLDPDSYNAWLVLGLTMRDHGDIAGATRAFRRAQEIQPMSADAWTNLGNILQEQGEFAEGIQAHRQALSLCPNHAAAENNLGHALRRAQRFDEAIAAFRRALAMQPDFAEAHNNLGVALLAKQELDEAIESFRRAIAICPAFADAHNNYGCAVLEKDLDVEGAVAAHRKAVSLKPDFAEAHYNLGLALLLQGDFREGWAEHEWRWLAPVLGLAHPRFPQPMWDGTPLGDRRILLHAEQGFGDTIQFARYATRLARDGGHVIVACMPELKRLMQTLDAVDLVVDSHDGLPAFDVCCPLASLPLLLGTTMQNIPAAVPYLHANPDDVDRWRRRLSTTSDRLKVGLVWAGGPRHARDRFRSIPLSALSPILNIAGVRLISLQKGQPSDLLRAEPLWEAIVDWTDELHDFAETAALIENLDLVITVDTAVAHLAGALGRRVFLLLPFLPDWRWMLNRTDSPWYPTMRLFRQPSAGDWAAPVQLVAEELRGILAEFGLNAEPASDESPSKR